MSTTMKIRLEPGLKYRLEQLARITGRSKSYLAAEAIREFIELNEWQLREIEQAVKEADNGDFAGEQAVKKILRKWAVGGDQVAPQRLADPRHGDGIDQGQPSTSSNAASSINVAR